MIRIAALIAWIIIITFAPARAEEKIKAYDVAIDVERSGDIHVSETITVISEGREIRRGIFRDLPRYYEKNGAKLPFNYNVESVTRDGRKEPYSIEKNGNAYRIRIGDADVFLQNGQHNYEINYTVKNQIRYFPGRDEFYWNAIGQYWAFPIDDANITVTFPEGAAINSVYAYTGQFGEQGGAYSYRAENGAHIFQSTGRLPARNGITISLSLEKGAIDPPSAADRRAEWWARYGGILLMAGVIALLSAYYGYAFNRVGRDPVKGPIFPHYEPPEGYSPAAVHHIYHRRLTGHTALVASLINLGIKKRIKIDTIDGETTATRLDEEKAKGDLFPIESLLFDTLLKNREAHTFGGKHSPSFVGAYSLFRKFAIEKYGAPYFKWNPQFFIIGTIVSIFAIIIAANISATWTVLHTLMVVALIILNLTMAYFMPAPTRIGQEVRTQIEGFRLYLKTAEKLQLNAVDIESDGPPPITTKRYERFLPYAIALGVEKPWTKHFEKALPNEARDYSPHWTSMRSGNYSSLNGLNSALVSSMSSGVSSSMPQSSSSSGGGGGGFSGGGGGGGGGGGW